MQAAGVAVTSVGAVGAAPNSAGASISGTVLTLQPTDATNPGVITTGTQTIAGAKTFTGAISASNLSGTNTGDQTITLTGGVTGSGVGSFAATVITNANLTGDVTSVGNATTLTNAPVIAKVLTGYTSGAGTVAATDSILQAIQKLNGNNEAAATLDAVTQSTGLITGGHLSIGTPTTTFSITSGTGTVVDNLSTPAVVTQVSWSAKTNVTATFIASGLVSYVAIDSAGNTFQQLAPFTNTQLRTYIQIGSLVHVNLTNLDAVNQFGDAAISPANQLADLSRGLGRFSISGNIFSANGANLNINKSVGTVYSQGSNWQTNKADPNVVSLASLTAASFQYRFSTGTNGATGTAINPDIYDLAGVSTAVTPNKFTVQRIYSFVSNNVKIQPGQTLYNSLAEAKGAIQTQVFTTEASIAANGILRGFLIVKEGTTSLQSATGAFFYESGKFSQQIGIGGQSVSTMQNAYDNSLDPEILTDATRGALSIRRGSAADTDNIIEGLNNASTITFGVTGAGVITTALTASRAVATGASSTLVASATTATELGYVNGVTSAIQTQINTKLPTTITTTGDIIYSSSGTTAARLGIGSSGQVLKVSGGLPTWAAFVAPSGGDITETSFSAANNQAVVADVTGLAFANGSVRSFQALVSVYINATSSLYEAFTLQGIQKGASWDMSVTSNGDASLIVFSITSAGQIQYTSGNYTGFSAGTIKFRAITTGT